MRVLTVVALAVLPVMAFVLFTGFDQRASLTQSLREDLAHRTRSVLDGESRFVEAARQLLVALTRVDAIKDKDPGACSAFAKDLAAQYTVYANIGVADIDGNVYCSAVPLAGPTNISDRPYFIRSVQTGGFARGDYQIGRITGRPTVNFAMPVRDVYGNADAVVFVALSIDALQQVVAFADLPDQGAFSIFDGNGRILARHPDPERWVGKIIPDAPIVKAAEARQSGFAEVSGLDGVVRLYHFRKVSQAGADVFVAVGVPRSVVLEPVDRSLTLNLVGVAAGALLAALAAIFIGDALVGRMLRAEEALTSLGVIVESTSDAVIGIDLEGKVTSWNRGASELYGLDAPAAVGRRFSELVHQRGADADQIVAKVAGGETVTDIQTVDDCQGREVEVAKTVSPIRRDGQITGISLIARDITVRKEAERALQDAYEKEKEAVARLQEVDRLKTEFVGIVSHDLRSPMSVISGYARILQTKWDEIDDEKKKEFLGAMLRTVENASLLVSDTLEVARIEAGEIEFQPTRFPLAKLATGVAADLEVANPSRRILVEAPDGLPDVLADRDRVLQVLNNLVTNALKFSQGDVHVRLSATDGYLQLSVQDQGIGMEPDDLPKVFDRFTRVKQPGDLPKVRGTGLGLYISRRLIEDQGGQIWVESVVGEGSTFSFTLPVAETA